MYYPRGMEKIHDKVKKEWITSMETNQDQKDALHVLTEIEKLVIENAEVGQQEK